MLEQLTPVSGAHSNEAKQRAGPIGELEDTGALERWQHPWRRPLTCPSNPGVRSNRGRCTWMQVFLAGAGRDGSRSINVGRRAHARAVRGRYLAIGTGPACCRCDAARRDEGIDAEKWDDRVSSHRVARWDACRVVMVVTATTSSAARDNFMKS